MDRLDEWQVFSMVASRRSFADAARALSRSPQQVTRAVAALEERLAVRLFHRTTRSVTLTNEGERCLERSRRALSEFDALESSLEPNAPLSGRLTVAAPVLFGQLHVAPVLREFLARHPRLDARLMLSDRVVSLAEEGVDVAARIGPLPDSSLRARLVAEVRPVVCASPGYLARAGTPRSPDALGGHSCIAFTTTTPIADRWTFTRSGAREKSVHVRARLIVDSGQAALDAAVAGLGIVRAISYQVDRLLAQKRLRAILQSYASPAVPVHLVHLPGATSRAAHEFGEFALEKLRARL